MQGMLQPLQPVNKQCVLGSLVHHSHSTGPKSCHNYY